MAAASPLPALLRLPGLTRLSVVCLGGVLAALFLRALLSHPDDLTQSLRELEKPGSCDEPPAPGGLGLFVGYIVLEPGLTAGLVLLDRLSVH